jgi:competence protein ComEC
VPGLAAASLVAGLATAPFGLAYFGRMSSFGLLANLLAMPVMDLLLMPGLVVAALLAPLGLAGPVLWLLGYGARWILAVAGWVAALPGASVVLPAPPAGALALLALGFLWLAIWQGRARLAGLPVMALSLLLWALADRPALLIADTGGLVGLATPQGRALSKPVGGFLAHAWLQADGDPVPLATAAARPGFSGPRAARRFTLGAVAGVVLSGKDAAAALPAACAEAGLVVLAARLATPPPPGCRVIDTRLLRRTGALALWPVAGGFRIVATRAMQGDRPWSRAGLRYPPRLPRLAPVLAAPDAGAQVAELGRGAVDQ